MSITTTTTTTAIPTALRDHDEQLAAYVVAPRSGAVTAPVAELCGERLASVPADAEHGGWICVQPKGHLPGLDHSAEDGTTW